MAKRQALLQARIDRERTDRLVGWLIAIGGAVLIAGKMLPALSTAGDYAAWWNALAAAHAGVILLFAVLGWWLPFPLLRAGWIAVPASGALLSILAFASYSGSEPDLALPWHWTLEAVGVSFFALVVRPWIAVIAVFVSGSLPAFSALMFLGFVPETIASLTPVHFTNIGFLALFLGMRAQINRFREAQSEALALRERQAREEAESARQAELSRLIHDEILSVFTAALALDGTPPRALRSAAQHALDLSSPPASPGLLLTADSMRSCEQVSTDLLVALRHIDSTLHTDMSQTPGWLPEAVGTALTLAAIEALRNSVQHAGPEAGRTLTARFEPNDACVVIADNGVGFDPDRIPAERLGVRSSIVGLMQRAGGDATIRSTPGVGTEVTLLWGR